MESLVLVNCISSNVRPDKMNASPLAECKALTGASTFPMPRLTLTSEGVACSRVMLIASVLQSRAVCKDIKGSLMYA